MGERVASAAGPEPGETVLDVACGKGSTLVPAARSVADTGRVAAIDIVPAMVEAARMAAREAGLGNVTVQVMDGEALEFADHTFDVTGHHRDHPRSADTRRRPNCQTHPIVRAGAPYRAA